MSLPPLPPRRQPAAGAVLTTLGSYPAGPVTAPRRELLERSGLTWTTWRRAVGTLGQLVEAKGGTRDGVEASYTLTAEGRAAADELAAHPETWATSPRGRATAHPRPTSPRARLSSPTAFKATQSEKAAASSPPVAHPPVAHPVAERLTDEDVERVAMATMRLLGQALGGHRYLKPENSVSLAPSPPAEPFAADRDLKPHNVHPALLHGPKHPAVVARRAVEAAAEGDPDSRDTPELVAAASQDLAAQIAAGTVRRPGALATAILQRMRKNPGDVQRAVQPAGEVVLFQSATRADAERKARELAKADQALGPSELDARLSQVVKSLTAPTQGRRLSEPLPVSARPTRA